MEVAADDMRGGLGDKLTGLPGLDSARERITAWMGEDAAAPAEARGHAMLLGLRRFDTVNRAYGEDAGDGVLGEVASRIAGFADEEMEAGWVAARAGGGAFLLAARDACSRERWQMLAEQLADAVARPIATPAGMVRLSPRVALVRVLGGDDFASVLDRLGQCLDAANRQEGARIAWAQGEAIPRGRTGAQLETDLMGAIDGEQIEILFQPQFGLPDNALIGAEALARWNHPELGKIGAGALFAIAERSDQIAPLSRHIAGKALEAARHWPEHLRLSLNVTPADLAFGSYVRQMLDIIRESGFAPRRLTLEITEQALISDVELAAQIMAEFCAQGIRIALDDFGAGFCNFRYLKILPLHYLKLDRSMIEGITREKRDLAVLRAIVAMARALDLQVIAEGIETEEQRAAIAAEGCASYQGFLRAEPMSAAKFEALAAGG
ncbi:GGDEF domain-containing protein [Novosphingobium sp. PC22D]|uniref:bifunctional diguanylate cyclase/phosphodiesterase n=1 Tax=Novosphingobium sp. PC22D TaxID=1962403 RepID=UPI000BF00726|nr:bifunctional diguanylate cyclase/phosphodiesterase [Novosphingobium sp. PC22D]PEQ11772.1 GGDEF domain-containing protein [Novosphingobium sp. PC22D]